MILNQLPNIEALIYTIIPVNMVIKIWDANQVNTPLS